MPSVLASPSPIRRYGGSNYSNYTSSSAYSRSSTSYGGRTSSLDRSTYSSYVSSYKYASGASGSSSKDYTSRPPIGSGALRNTTVAPSSIYSSSRVSPARSYLSRKSTSTEDGGGSSTTSAGSSSSLRNRETQSESREGNNNTYTNGNVRRGVRDYSAYSPTSSSSTSTLSKYRTSAASQPVSRSKYGDYSDTSKTEMPKINERVRSYQSSREPVFQSRFLRSRQDNAAAIQAASAVKSDDKSAVSEEAEEEPRPSVAELRRRYDQNRNDVGAAKETSAKSTARVRSPSESDSEDSSDRDTIRSSVSPAKPPPPPPLPPPVSTAKSSTARRVQNSPDRIASNGALDRKDATKSREPEDNKAIHQSSNDARRSSSPSTLSSSSDGESLDNVASPVAERRPTVTRSRAAATSATPGRVTASRNSISDSDSESLSKSPKLSANRKAKLAASAAATAAAAAAAAASSSTSNSLERQGLVGFRNIGNTCFMNSVLQCLSNTRSVLEYVLNDEYASHINTTISSMNGALIKAFATVMCELWKQEDDEYLSGAVNPTALKTQIQKFAPRFMGYNQQDSQEFLRYLLEGLHEDVNRVPVKPKPLEHDIDDNLSDAQKATESWKRYLRRDDSKIVDLFVGQLKSTLQCTVCGHCSVTFDPFWDLSLPIPPSARSVSSVKVQHCLELFAKEEILDGDEKPTCAKCQARRKCTKTFSIQKFPQILVLHLKRFSPGERFRKLDASVDFPLTDLDLSAYSAAGLKPTPCSYRLYGVINHSGTAYSGHYTAFCRHPYSNTWHEYNDSRVTNISPQRIVSPEAYLLFYEMESQEARL